jgi:hypothetical protein
MLQFLIGLSLVGFILVNLYWMDRIIFRRTPKAARQDFIDDVMTAVAFALDWLVGLLLLLSLLLLLLIVFVPALCVYAYQRVRFGRQRTSFSSAIVSLREGILTLMAAIGAPFRRILSLRKRK